MLRFTPILLLTLCGCALLTATPQSELARLEREEAERQQQIQKEAVARGTWVQEPTTAVVSRAEVQPSTGFGPPSSAPAGSSDVGSLTVDQILAHGPGGVEGAEMAQKCAEIRKVFGKTNRSPQEIESAVRTYAMSLVIQYRKNTDSPGEHHYKVVRVTYDSRDNVAGEKVVFETSDLTIAKQKARENSGPHSTGEVQENGESIYSSN